MSSGERHALDIRVNSTVEPEMIGVAVLSQASVQRNLQRFRADEL